MPLLSTTQIAGVLAFMGLPGAGKTTIAAEIARRDRSFRIVSRDTIRAAMFQPCRFTLDEKRAAFEAVLIATRAILAAGDSVLTDGMALSTVGDLEAIEAVAHECGHRFLAVYCACPLEVAVHRVENDIANGTHLATDRTPDLVRDVASRFRGIPANAMTIDTQEKVSDNAEAILTRWREDGQQQIR